MSSVDMSEFELLSKNMQEVREYVSEMYAANKEGFGKVIVKVEEEFEAGVDAAELASTLAGFALSAVGIAASIMGNAAMMSALEQIGKEITALAKEMQQMEQAILQAITQATYTDVAAVLDDEIDQYLDPPQNDYQELVRETAAKQPQNPGALARVIAYGSGDSGQSAAGILIAIHDTQIGDGSKQGLMSLLASLQKGGGRFWSNTVQGLLAMQQYGKYAGYQQQAAQLAAGAYHAECPPEYDLAANYTNLCADQLQQQWSCLAFGLPNDAVVIDRQSPNLHKQYYEHDAKGGSGAPLMWYVNVAATNQNYVQACVFAGKASVAGYSDWRLPTVTDLKFLHQAGSIADMNTLGFQLSKTLGYVWTSTQYIETILDLKHNMTILFNVNTGKLEAFDLGLRKQTLPVILVRTMKTPADCMLLEQFTSYKIQATSKSRLQCMGIAGGSAQDITEDVFWTSSNPQVATVSNAHGQQGTVTWLKIDAGPVTITASRTPMVLVSGGQFATSGSLSLSPPSMYVTPALTDLLLCPSGKNYTTTGKGVGAYHVTAVYSDGSGPEVTTQVQWTTSDNNAVISVQPGFEGTLSINGPVKNPVTITATFNGMSATTQFSVMSSKQAGVQESGHKV